jgi:hypothetical protein
MSLWQDEKYVRLLSHRLDQYHDRGRHQYNFRCPLCGDSQKNKSKARGYLFPQRDVLLFKCHNCSLAMPFSALLKRVDPSLYSEYLTERFREERQRATPAPARVVPPPVVRHFDPALVPTVAQSNIVPVIAFCRGRKLDATAMGRLHATTRARTWLTPLVGAKASDVADDVAYLVQPLTLPGGAWYGAQLRGVKQKSFVTFRWSHDLMKVFGLDAWKPEDVTYVVEGPIDALFVPNAIAACGSDLVSAVDNMREMVPVPVDWPDRAIFVWDNEPHNKEVASHIRRAIARGLRVVIWPYYRAGEENFPKDINDMVRAGIDVMAHLRRHTMTGLAAKAAFEAWLRTCTSTLSADTR